MVSDTIIGLDVHADSITAAILPVPGNIEGPLPKPEIHMSGDCSSRQPGITTTASAQR